VDEQAKMMGIAPGTTLVPYLATGALKAADAPAPVRWLTPFVRYHSADAMSGQVLLMLAGMITTMFAIYSYNRRDIA
jgi:hypothetical protein